MRVSEIASWHLTIKLELYVVILNRHSYHMNKLHDREEFRTLKTCKWEVQFIVHRLL